jgi:hypothetical protein
MRRRTLLTLSGLQQAAICPGSAVLPRIGSTSAKADMGSALHEYNAVKGEHGKRAADDQADEIADRWNLEGKERAMFFARARALDLGIPDGALYEVSLCLRADGTVEPTPGGRGEYMAPEDAIVAGTLDILFATPEPIQDGAWCPRDSVLWTPDLKTGDEAYVAPIARNWQARVSALLGARWTGADAVVPAIVFPSANGGSWDVPTDHGRPIPLRRKELAKIDADLRALHATVTEQSERVAAGKMPKLVTGTHCTYCAARAGCPAHVSETKALIAGDTGLTTGPLTREQAVKVAGLLGPARAALKAAEEALRAHVETFGPVQLPDGKVYGPSVTEESTYHVREVYQALLEEFEPIVGAEKADEMASKAFTATKSGIYDAIEEAHTFAGIKRQKKNTFERIVSAPGVVTKEPAVRWGAHYPKT